MFPTRRRRRRFRSVEVHVHVLSRGSENNQTASCFHTQTHTEDQLSAAWQTGTRYYRVSC